MIGGQIFGAAGAQGRHGLGRSTWKTLSVLFLAVLVVCDAQPIHGQSGGVSRATGGGLRMVIDTQWPDGTGYRPVRVTVTPTAAPIADRTLVFEFTTINQNRGVGKTHVVQDIELPAGTGPVTTTVAVPHMIGHNNYRFRVGEGGREIRGLAGGGSFQANAHFETAPRVLLISDQTVSSGNLGRSFVNFNVNPPQGSGQYALPTFHTIAVKDVLSRWIEYSALDVICLSVGDLQVLKTTHAAGFRAILDWTAAGGNLLVFDAGAQWERRELLERLLDLPASEESGGEPRNRWQAPRKGKFGKAVGGIGPEAFGPYQEINDEYQQRYQNYTPYGNQMVTVREDAVEKKAAKKKGPRPTASDVSPFVSRPYEMGMVVAIAADKPFDQDPGFWAWVCNHLTSRRLIWYQRHGISLHQDNPGFFKFLIEGVGKAPLNAFRVLISLFVLAIGPFNYYLLRRFRRLHLLVVTVPVSAAAVTMALFAYAVFSDGLGTRVRVRSVTQINQRTGQTECWARLSYYSGLAPGGGLTFSEDVAVYPIQPVVGDLASGNRDLVWYQGQKLTNGWLRSRTPTQFLTVRSRKSQLGIDVGQPTDTGVPVANRLGTDVKLLVLRHKAGDLYWAKDLTDGLKTSATSVDAADAAADLLEEVQGCRMVNPPGVDPSNYQYSNNRRYYYYAYSGTGPNPQPDTCLMEGAIRGAGRSPSSPLSELAPGSYIAVVPLSPEVELGTSSARPEASLHLVFGTW